MNVKKTVFGSNGFSQYITGKKRSHF